jgi:protein involved in polysaccharide export with SLBB domain
MLPGEGLKKLMLFAGGTTDNAYLKNVQVTRFEEDGEVIIDVDYAAIQKGASDFRLQKGDRVLLNFQEDLR